MRYLRAVFTKDGGAIHPWGETLARDESVLRGPMYVMEMVDDEVAKMLCRVYGDVERGFGLTRDHPLVRTATLVDTARGLLSLRVEMPTEPRQMLRFQRETDIILVMPLQFRQTDGAPVATLLGDDESFDDSLDAVPAAVDVELLETGEYEPEPDDPIASLTPTQQRVLLSAVEEGYYECPREATQDELADAVDLAPGTVGEHLRKIESRVFSHLVE